MKLLPSIVVLLLLCYLPVHASDMSLSFKGGLSVSQQDWENSPVSSFSSPDWDNYNGWSAGAAVQRRLTTHIVMSAGVQYLRRGRSIELKLTGYDRTPLGTKDFREFAAYLSIPLMLKMHIPETTWDFYLQGGISQNFKVGKGSDFGTSEVFDQYKSSVTDAIVGFGVEPVRFSFGAMFIEFMYAWDISDAFKSDVATVRTSSYDVNIGIRFSLSQ